MLERAARAHEDVLARALGADALLPFRFGVVVAGEDDVRALLRADAGSFAARLATVRGAREWGVKALLDVELLGDALVADDPTLAELRSGAGSGTGSAFFARKRFEQQLTDRVRDAAAELAQVAHERLAGCARDAVANPPQPRGLSGHDAEMILNGAYLVERDREEELGAVVEELRAELEPQGVTLEPTGPWPPFNFVDAAAEQVL